MTEPLPLAPKDGAGATEPDEVEVLEDLTGGPADDDGVFRGEVS